MVIWLISEVIIRVSSKSLLQINTIRSLITEERIVLELFFLSSSAIEFEELHFCSGCFSSACNGHENNFCVVIKFGDNLVIRK